MTDDHNYPCGWEPCPVCLGVDQTWEWTEDVPVIEPT